MSSDQVVSRHESHEAHARVHRDADFWRQRLHAADLRVTDQRLLVLDILDAHPHSDAAFVTAEAQSRSEHPTEQPGRTSPVPAGGHAAPRATSAKSPLTLQGTHVILQQLFVAGLLRRVDLPGTKSARYETRVGDNHHHVECVVCGRIEDVDCVVGEAPCLTPSQTHGMQILEADIVFRGVCAQCAAAFDERPRDIAEAQGLASPTVA